jgi:hypothetical protein
MSAVVRIWILKLRLSGFRVKKNILRLISTFEKDNITSVVADPDPGSNA